MVNKRVFWIVATMALLSACGKEQTPEVYVPEEGEILLNMIHPHHSTRVNDTGFDADDQIGVYVTKSDLELQLVGNEVNNELFIYNGTTWSSQRRVFWNEGTHNVYAYYPYTAAVNDIEDFSFSVQTDQSTDEGYSMSDFLWASSTGVAATNEPVNMQFEHKLSRVVVKLEKGEEFEGEISESAEVYIDSTVPDAVIDLSTGDAAKDTFKSPSIIRCKQLANDTYAAIVIPQNLTSKVPLVEVVIGDVSYLMYGKISLRPGFSHTIVVTLNHNPEKIKIDIGGSTGDWN
ncbi:MAG: fimbrillin family protein [Rikenellaceae bacterium]|nr:fimbrillin family protein [Rikenellaceae bacterium]